MLKLIKDVFEWLNNRFWMHRYVYVNPFNRRCVVCGRNEVMYSEDWKDCKNLTKGWWEVHDEGLEEKHHVK